MSLPTLRGPRWVDLRLHRTALLTGGALLLAALAFTGWLRWAARAYPEPMGRCVSDGTCDTFFGFASARDMLYSSMENGSVGLLVLPALIGAFVAGPLIGRELESGLYKLSWTQSVSPARWLTSKLTIAAALAVGGTLFLMAVLQLGAGYAIGRRSDVHWDYQGVYEATGPVLVAYGLLGVAVGAAVGLLVRRTLLAVSLTAVVTGGVLLLFGSLRWDLFPTRTLTETSRVGGSWYISEPYDSFAVDQGVTNAAGERFIEGLCHPKPTPGYFCPTDTKITSAYLDYHPRSHFWYLQLIETGIVLALAAAATYAAFRLLRRRAA
ncbi:ABC transporter permease [Streptomyces sp. NPDC004732]|uniref:ABC transporter permease n=1 Tax=Streptomyces sp. NPDC004732 TaxID=3154290 RepID=UPI0033B9749C